MCTAVVRYEPGAEWPYLVAFVRDEDRSREAEAPGPWWERHATTVGGRDTRAGGTWLAVNTAAPPVLAFVLNRAEPGLPPPMDGGSATRGTVPLDAAAAGSGFDPEANIAALHLMAPFHLVRLSSSDRAGHEEGWWRWDGRSLEFSTLEAGVTVIGSRGPALVGEPARRATLAQRFTEATTPALAGGSATAWGEWIALLDGRTTQHDDVSPLTVRGVSERPGFGTVGASLVALATDGRVRYDVNSTHDLDPAAWTPVTLPAVSNPNPGAERATAQGE